MSKLIKILLLSATLLGSTAVASAARADDGAVVAARKLPAAARTSLQQDVAKARKDSPEAFQSVARVGDKMASLDASRRGRLAAVAPLLKALGPKALLPMIERAALQSPPRGSLTDSAWKAWRIGLIEAIGSLRDKRSAPLFVAVLQGDDDDFDILRVTAEAMGKLSDDASAQQLVALSRAAGPRQKAILAGMGECRRLAAAQALADASRSVTDEDTLRLLGKSLGQVGSVWAWKTPAVAVHQAEEAAVRALAAKALMGMFVAHEGDVRTAATTGLLMVDDPSTTQLIADARSGASPALNAALDELARRVAKNPLR